MDLFVFRTSFRSPDQVELVVEHPDPGPHQLVHGSKIFPKDGLVHVRGVKVPDHHGHLAAFVIEFQFLGPEEIIGDQVAEAYGNSHDNSQNQAHVTVHEPGA